MANYEATTRTNYFHVTNEEDFRKIFSLFEEKYCIELNRGEDDTFMFGSYNSLDLDDVAELQAIVPEDDCIILMESGHEKLNYVAGTVQVITAKTIESLDMTDLALKAAKEALHNPNYKTQLDY